MQSTGRIQRVYYLILALFWLATGLPMALTVLLAQARGLDLFQVGLVMGVYALTIVVLEVPTGGLADAVGRKPVALLAYGFILASSVLIFFAFSFSAFLVALVCYGIGRALSSGALDAWFVDALQEADPTIELQPALARASSVTLLAVGVGTLLGSALPRLFPSLPPDGSAILTPLAVPWLAAMLVKAVMIVLAACLVRENRPGGAERSWLRGARQVPQIVVTGFDLSRRNPTILLLLGATLAGGLVVSSLEVLWQPHFAALLGGAADHSLLFGVVMGGNFVVGMLGNTLSTPLSRLLGKRYGLVAAIFQGVRGVTLLALALQSGPLGAAVLFWLVYLNMGVVNPLHSTLMNQQIPAEHRSSMLSISSLVSYVGSFIGSSGLGFVAQQTSTGVAWGIGGVLLLLSVTMYLRVDARQKERHVEQTQLLKAG